jgi:hypothetical protein
VVRAAQSNGIWAIPHDTLKLAATCHFQYDCHEEEALAPLHAEEVGSSPDARQTANT